LYQTQQSLYSIASGGLTGLGIGNCRQKHLWLPEASNDFIFSVLCEELGFIGCMIVLLLFLLFVFECLRMASRARDMAGRLFCTGMAALVGFQSFTNIAVATGVFPNTGLPLPFISYGVSSLASLYIGIGILLNVGLQQRKLEF